MDSNSISLPLGDPPIVLSSANAKIDEQWFKPLTESPEHSKCPTGPEPHLILKTSEIRIQRLEKRIRKLIEQRDDARKRLAVLTEMIKLYPYLDSRYEAYKERQENAKRLREYDAMVPLLVSENERLKAQIQILTSISRTEEQ